MSSDRPKHQPCQCGCGELADECMSGHNPLAAFRIDAPDRVVRIHLYEEDPDDAA